MARAKKIIIAVESIHPDTLRPESVGKYLTNFICLESNATKCFESSSLRNAWKTITKPENEIDALLKEREKPKKGTQFFGEEEISILDIAVSDKVKSNTDYIYRFRCCENCSLSTDKYITYKELIAEIFKKIKNKYVLVTYDGNRDRMELTEDGIGNIIARMANKTCSVIISTFDRSGNDGDSYDITIYKNLIYA